MILFDEGNPEKSKLSASIEANSLECDNNMALKEGAKKPEALDAEKFPTISFESTSIVKKDSAVTGVFKTLLFLLADSPIFGYEATGNLTIKGITKEIKLPFTFEKEVFKGGFTINPKDFNITSTAFQKNLNIVLNIPVSQ